MNNVASWRCLRTMCFEYETSRLLCIVCRSLQVCYAGSLQVFMCLHALYRIYVCGGDHSVLKPIRNLAKQNLLSFFLCPLALRSLSSIHTTCSRNFEGHFRGCSVVVWRSVLEACQDCLKGTHRQRHYNPKPLNKYLFSSSKHFLVVST